MHQPVTLGAPAPQQQQMAPKGPPSSYDDVQGTKFAELLASGAFQVLKGQYFVDQYAKAQPIQMRQDVPEEYAWRGPEALQRWIKYGPRFLVAVSYAWLAQAHPDPDLYHLQRLARITQAHRKVFSVRPDKFVRYDDDDRGNHFLEGDIGVILDYCCFYQKKVVDGVDVRTDAQKAQLKAGLEEINTVYGHSAITAWRLEEVPDHVERKYADRGWTLFERVIIDAKGTWEANVPTNLVFSGKTDAGTCSDKELDGIIGDALWGAGQTLRKPPWTPARFEVELHKRSEACQAKNVPLFTNGKEDFPLVRRKYGDSYRLLCEATSLSYQNASRWSTSDVEVLLEVLPDFKKLEKLNVQNLRICVGSGLLASRLAEMMRAGQLPKLRSIYFAHDWLDPCSQAKMLHAWSSRQKCCCPCDCCFCGLCLGPSCLGLGCWCWGCDRDGECSMLAMNYQCRGGLC